MMRILIIDDDESISRLLEYHLKKEKYDVLKTASGEKALELLKKNLVHLVLQDVYLPGIGGTELLTEIMQLRPEIPVIMMTATGSIELAVHSVKMGAFDFLAKPIDIEHMKISIRNALKNFDLQNEIENLRSKLSDQFQYSNIIGKSPAMKNIFKLIEKVKDNEISVLIQGENGTGKELIAKAIHYNPR